jgi:hypothetical protein
MATYAEKRLYSGQPATGGATLYTVPASTTTIVKQVVIANTSGSAATVSLRLVPSGGTAGVANSLAEAVSIGANSTQTLDLSQVMATGDFLQALQGTSGAITLTISGVEKT